MSRRANSYNWDSADVLKDVAVALFTAHQPIDLVHQKKIMETMKSLGYDTNWENVR